MGHLHRPALLDTFGNVAEMIAPNEDVSWSWCCSVEIGLHHLAADRLFAPKSTETARIMDYLEDHHFFAVGLV
jgi:hypothetical protein